MRIDDDALVQSLYDGVFDTPLWHGFLRQLLAKSQARYAVMQFRPIAGEAERVLYAGADIPMEQRAAMARIVLPDHISRITPAAAVMRDGRVYALAEIAPPDGDGDGDRDRDSAAGVLTLLKLAHGITDMRCVRVIEVGGVELWLSLWGGRGIGSVTAALLTALAPHVRIALRTMAELDRERFRSAVTGQAIEKLKMGWFTIDAKCQILETTNNIEQLFQWGSLLRRGRYNRLIPASPTIDRQMTALVKSYTNGEGRAQAFTLSQDPWVDMLVTPMRDTGFRDTGLARPNAVAVVYISGDRRSEADRCDQLVELFGLLPSEARLAWMLSQASSIKEAAAALNLTEETARNYSKKIYAKTGARGQAELVRIVLTSVLALS